MDGARFDQLVRELLGGASRRSLLHVLGALPVVGGLASVVDDAEAKNGKGKDKGKGNNHKNKDNEVAGEKNKAKRRKKQCQKRKQQACVGQCGVVSVKCKKGNGKNKRKQVNCGPCVCEPACEGGECCSDGVCVAECPEGQSCIDGACAVVECTVCDSGCPYTSVQEAIDDPEAGDTITLCAQTYGGNITINRNLTIVGAGDDATTLEGDGTASVVSIASDLTVEIQDLTISGGEASGGNPVGGGIANGTAQTTLIGVHVTGNIAGGHGGGIYINDGGQVTLNNSRVTGNAAGEAGGGIAALGSLALVNESVVADNEAGTDGGGIAIGEGGAATIDATSTVTDNFAADDGGGVYNSSGTITCEAAVVTNNTAGDPEEPSNCIDDGAPGGCDSCNEA